MQNDQVDDFRLGVLNISKINVPDQNRLFNSPIKVKNKPLGSPLSGNKKNLMARKIPTNEKMVQPRTVEKLGITKRILFRRRERMRNENLLLFYFDGVIGDLNGQQGYNNFRVRAGTFAGLRKLYSNF